MHVTSVYYNGGPFSICWLSAFTATRQVFVQKPRDGLLLRMHCNAYGDTMLTVGRVTRLARPSVCPVRARNSKAKQKHTKIKIGIHVLHGTSKRNAIFQLKRSKVKVKNSTSINRQSRLSSGIKKSTHSFAGGRHKLDGRPHNMNDVFGGRGEGTGCRCWGPLNIITWYDSLEAWASRWLASG